jgi:hypothetical protein
LPPSFATHCSLRFAAAISSSPRAVSTRVLCAYVVVPETIVAIAISHRSLVRLMALPFPHNEIVAVFCPATNRMHRKDFFQASRSSEGAYTLKLVELAMDKHRDDDD